MLPKSEDQAQVQGIRASGDRCAYLGCVDSLGLEVNAGRGGKGQPPTGNEGGDRSKLRGSQQSSFARGDTDIR